MASLQHVYRRGHIFWWRRVHDLFYNRRVDVRLSLGTTDRFEARNRGAALSAALPGVRSMLEQEIRENSEVTEGELRAIAKEMYHARLLEVCTMQRAEPSLAELHSATNLAFIVYFERLKSLGGHASFSSAEERSWLERGCDPQRIADLKTIIAMRENKGVSPIRREEIDHHLTRAGFTPDDKLRWMLELLLYPAYRDAYADAESELQDGYQDLGFDSPENDEPDVTFDPQPNGGSSKPSINKKWLAWTPTEVAEAMIAATPKLSGHRKKGKRGSSTVEEQTLRQIRWAATLLQKSLPTGTPLYKVTETDIARLDVFFDQLSCRYGKSNTDRILSETLEEAAKRAIDDVAEGNLPPEEVGFSTRTSNKHFGKLAQIFRYMWKTTGTQANIDFSKFMIDVPRNARDDRDRLTNEQGKALFSLAPWTGCKSERKGDRLKGGDYLCHDGLFFVPLLVWYTGARREEVCKLMVDDVKTDASIPSIHIRPTEIGRVKNKAADRVIAIADELIRLGFVRYVKAMRADGERLLFPELMPASSTKRTLGDVFYKIWWIYLAPHVPDLKRGQAMHAARHMVSDELKQQEVSLEFRNDHLGHTGKGGEGETRYPSAASLEKLLKLVNMIPVVTGHLPDQTTVQLLSKSLRCPRPGRLK